MTRFLHHFGYDLVRPLSETVKLLEHHRVDCVVDVGANDGGFATAIRRHGYAGRIISFEPLREPFESLRKKAVTDGNWDTVQCAVGDTRSAVTLNVFGKRGEASSVLPMLEACAKAAPNLHCVGTETVNQERLDQLLPPMGLQPDSRTFLKVDVQGYERAVLDGASGLFAGRAIAGLQLELSLVPLYGGAMTYQEGFDRAERLGMTLMRVDPIFDDPESGQTLQVDAVFFAV